MFWSFKTVGLQNCLGGLISLSLDNGNKMSPPPITDLGISWRLLQKNHCIVNFQGLFFFLNQIECLFCSWRRSKGLDYLHILSYSSSFLLSSFTAWWWHYWLLFGALGPTFWSTAERDSTWGQTVLHGEGWESHIILLIFSLKLVENWLCAWKWRWWRKNKI